MKDLQSYVDEDYRKSPEEARSAEALTLYESIAHVAAPDLKP